MSKDGSAPEYRYFEFKEDVEASSSAAAQRKGWYCLNVGCNFAIGGRQPKVDKMRRHLAGNEELAKGVLSKSSLCRFSDDACKELFTGEIKRRLDDQEEGRNSWGSNRQAWLSARCVRTSNCLLFNLFCLCS